MVTILKKIHLDEHVDRRLRHMFKNIVDEKTFFQFWRTLQIEVSEYSQCVILNLNLKKLIISCSSNVAEFTVRGIGNE